MLHFNSLFSSDENNRENINIPGSSIENAETSRRDWSSPFGSSDLSARRSAVCVFSCSITRLPSYFPLSLQPSPGRPHRGALYRPSITRVPSAEKLPPVFTRRFANRTQCHITRLQHEKGTSRKKKRGQAGVRWVKRTSGRRRKKRKPNTEFNYRSVVARISLLLFLSRTPSPLCSFSGKAAEGCKGCSIEARVSLFRQLGRKQQWRPLCSQCLLL